MAFVQNIAGTYVKQPRLGLGQILPANTTAQVTVITAGGSGSKVVSLTVSSTDTTNRDIQVSVVRGGITYVLTTTTVPLTSGFAAGIAPVDLLALFPIGSLPVDNDGESYLFLESGDTLVVNSLTTVTAAKVISAVAVYGDF
jgi:hypothetical protein